MEKFILTRPTGDYAGQIREYRQEFLDAGDSMDGCGPLRRLVDPEEYIQECKNYEDPAKVPPHLVPATQFLFVRRSDSRLVGMIQVRHRLNDFLEKYARAYRLFRKAERTGQGLCERNAQNDASVLP